MNVGGVSGGEGASQPLEQCYVHRARGLSEGSGLEAQRRPWGAGPARKAWAVGERVQGCPLRAGSSVTTEWGGSDWRAGLQREAGERPGGVSVCLWGSLPVFALSWRGCPTPQHAPGHCAWCPPHASYPLLSWTLSSVICVPGTGPRPAASICGVLAWVSG